MRFFWFLLRLVLFLGVLFFLGNEPGTARIVWGDKIVETSAAFLAILVFGGSFALYLLYRTWRALWDGPRFWRLHQKIGRMERGQDLIAKGLVAIAGGNAAEAGRLAVAARKALGPTIGTKLLQAQAAQLAGDHRVAAEIFKGLALEGESAVLGYRGLIMEALRAGDWDEVDSLIERLKREKPEVPWLSVIQFDLAVRRRRWADASGYLAKAAAAKLVEPKEAARREAALLLAESEIEARHKLDDRALQTAEKALRRAPGWLPAALNLAERQIAGTHYRAALRLIEKTWNATPHPTLVLLSLKAARTTKPIEAYKQIEKLTRNNPTHPASLLALGEAALVADLWGEARRHLLALVKAGQASQKAFVLLADLERREGKGERAAFGWLSRLPDARPHPRWVCASCGGAHEAWQAQCPSCGAFNSLAWGVPGEGKGAEDRVMLSSFPG